MTVIDSINQINALIDSAPTRAAVLDFLDYLRVGADYASLLTGVAEWRIVTNTGREVAAISGRNLISSNGVVISLPDSASLSNVAARQWYLDQEARIPSLIDSTASLQDQAFQASNLRNLFRTATRDAMIDQKIAAQLNITNPNLTWDQIVQKYSSSYSGDELWKQIIGASQRSRGTVNQSLGLNPLKGKK